LAAIYARYRPMLISWAYHCCAHTASADSADDLADQALARAWFALTPARFATFASLPQLLGYLRACVATTVIDSARAQAAADRASQKLQTQAPQRRSSASWLLSTARRYGRRRWPSSPPRLSASYWSRA
jgi:hypothetical protein